MIKKWNFSKTVSAIEEEHPKDMGYCYAVRFYVMPGFYLTKIGATKSPKSRFSSIPRAKIYCVSPPHYNYYENEEILHEAFSRFRVPRKPNGKSQVELFNIDLKYFFENLPNMNYETEINNCEKKLLPNGSVWLKQKKSNFTLDK